MSVSIRYEIQITNPKIHLIHVTCYITLPKKKVLQFSMAKWVPGSYLIRDFSKHIVTLKVTAEGHALPIAKKDTSTWNCDEKHDCFEINYDIYAFDKSPRGAYVDNTRVFFDGATVFLKCHELEDVPIEVTFLKPTACEYIDWQLETTLDSVEVANHGFGRYQAKNYFDLIDHPVLMGCHDKITFHVDNILHQIILFGHTKLDKERLGQDIQQLCVAEKNFWGGYPNDFNRYTFYLRASADEYGGLEHQFSSSLVCARSDLPQKHYLGVTEDYQKLLGLFSHEYFHLWHVKRLKPKIWVKPNLSSVSLTKQLWIFEGITSYFDDLLLVSAKLITLTDYLVSLSKTLSRHLTTPGNQVQTLEDSSIDAWIKFYQPNENTRNSQVSYYLKGAIVALCLDLTIIQKTEGKKSLRDILQALFHRFGASEVGIEEGVFEAVASEVTGLDLNNFFDHALRSCADIDFVTPLLSVGVKCDWKKVDCLQQLGLIFSPQQDNIKIQMVLANTAAEKAGLAAYDKIIAIDRFKVNQVRDLEKMLLMYDEKDHFIMHVFRGDELMTFELAMPTSDMKAVILSAISDLDDRTKQLRDKWLVQQ